MARDEAVTLPESNPDKRLTAPANTKRDPFFMLRREASRCEELESCLRVVRDSRDRMALRLIEQGHTWREVAAAGGFANPYIAALKKRGQGEQS